MPATVTHAFFAKDLYNELPVDIKKKIDVDRLKMFGQSMDSLRFYNFFSFKSSKYYTKIGEVFHSKDSQKYFITLINYIKDNQFHNDIDTMSYLIGLICHYVLDYNTHPLVLYKTGVFDKKKPNTYKYNNVHLFMEVFLDNYLIKTREMINPYRFHISKYCFDTKAFSNNLDKCIEYSFSKTYGVKDMDKIYYKSLKNMKVALRLFRQDRFGIKKIIYKLADTFTPRSMFRFEAISYHYPLCDNHNYLNSNHSTWHNPVEYSITSNESFLDLYLKSLKIAKDIVINSYKYISGEDIKLEDVFTNKSYVTGLDCDNDKDLKYFEF